MIQNLRQIKLRIRSIENTRKITKAMEMISATKLNRVKSALYALRPYFAGMESIVSHMVSPREGYAHPYTAARQRVGTVALCVVASDTGLCGTYNNAVLKAADDFLSNLRGVNVRIIAIGKEAVRHFAKQEIVPWHSYLGLYGRYSAKVSDEICGDLATMFMKAEADEVYVAYMRFNPSLRHASVIEKVLPLERPAAPDGYYIYEPDAESILDRIIPRYFAARISLVLLDAFTSEHSARMLAMKTATDNAGDLIDRLTLMRNKARQYAITKEVLEIAMSAEALKG